MTTPLEGTGPVIPDFEKDAQSLAAYDDARLRYERREASDAEGRTRATFDKKRSAIRAEIAVAASLLEERRIKAEKALAAYAKRYPHRIDRNKPVKPGFWENLFSLGSAGRAFNRAVQTAADAVQAQSLRRRKEHDEEELEQQLKRALYLQEDAIKKKLESPDGITAFHARPGVAVLHKRVEEIKAERAQYAARLEKGAVPPQEQRDREFAERKISQLEVPFAGLAIVRVARYGPLSLLHPARPRTQALPSRLRCATRTADRKRPRRLPARRLVRNAPQPRCRRSPDAGRRPLRRELQG